MLQLNINIDMVLYRCCNCHLNIDNMSTEVWYVLCSSYFVLLPPCNNSGGRGGERRGIVCWVLSVFDRFWHMFHLKFCCSCLAPTVIIIFNFEIKITFCTILIFFLLLVSVCKRVLKWRKSKGQKREKD